jgi:hypothetical protein
MTTKKKPRYPKRKRRATKRDTLDKLSQHYITLNEMYRAARDAGFTHETAFWLITEPGSSLPDWVNPPNSPGIIPRIDPDDDED